VIPVLPRIVGFDRRKTKRPALPICAPPAFNAPATTSFTGQDTKPPRKVASLLEPLQPPMDWSPPCAPNPRRPDENCGMGGMRMEAIMTAGFDSLRTASVGRRLPIHWNLGGLTARILGLRGPSFITKQCASATWPVQPYVVLDKMGVFGPMATLGL
jgi:hypothetical protein